MLQPKFSVLVPAHQEEAVLARCLDALQSQVQPGHVEVAVVANGCTDRTAAIAARHPLGPRVLELPQGSKSGALNAGDAALSAFPRIYLDADIVLGPGAVEAMLLTLSQSDVLVTAPTPHFVLSGRPWVVRSYYRTWERLPFLREEPVGNGVYALSAQGRSRFRQFPDIIADDLFVLRHFTGRERRALRHVTFAVEAPWRLRDLLAVRTRAYLGALELEAWEGGRLAADATGRTNRIGSLVALFGKPSDAPKLLIYALVSALASARAGRRWRRGETRTWDRDGSTR